MGVRAVSAQPTPGPLLSEGASHTHTTSAGSNYEAALAAESKRVIRCFQSYTAEQRADRSASFRLGHKQRRAVGEYYYVHPDCPSRAFSTRKAAALYALETAP